MKKTVSYFVAIVFTIATLTSRPFFAQGPPGGGGPGPCTTPPCLPPPPPGLAPIDEGVIFLLISGVILGVVSLRRRV